MEINSNFIDQAAEGFAALGSPARLHVLGAIVRGGETGLTVGAITTKTGIGGSTLNHHLKALANAGLIIQEREGRSILNRAAYDQIEALSGYILKECCADVVSDTPDHPLAQPNEPKEHRHVR